MHAPHSSTLYPDQTSDKAQYPQGSHWTSDLCPPCLLHWRKSSEAYRPHVLASWFLYLALCRGSGKHPGQTQDTLSLPSPPCCPFLLYCLCPAGPGALPCLHSPRRDRIGRGYSCWVRGTRMWCWGAEPAVSLVVCPPPLLLPNP